MDYFLICYDVRSNKQRTKLSKYLRQQGFRRLQKSVFIGKIKPKKAVLLPQKLVPMIELAFDRLCILPISQTLVGNIEAFGEGSDTLAWLVAQNPIAQYL